MSQSVLCVGESLMRLSTQTGVHFYDTTSLNLHYGGAEANVAINLKSLGNQTSYFTKVPNNQLGQSAIIHTQKYGVDIQNVIFGGDRLGSYYLEAGAGPRAASVIYDRAYSSFSALTVEEVDFEGLLENKSMLHITGITAALSENMAEITYEFIKKAHEKGIAVNFDVNYRSKLWSVAECSQFLKKVLPYVDYLSAGKLDAINFLGIEAHDSNLNLSETEALDYYYQKMREMYPNIKIFYSTIRNVISATHNTLQGIFWKNGQIYHSAEQDIDYIVDRVGGGDAFAAGILHGILSDRSPEYTINFATAMSTLKHTIHGDLAPFTIEQIERTMESDARVIR